MQNVISSGSVDRACLEFQEAIFAIREAIRGAVAIFAVKYKARPGLLNTFLTIFFNTLSSFLPIFLKKTTKSFCLYITNSHRVFFYYKRNNNQLLTYYLWMLYHQKCFL